MSARGLGVGGTGQTNDATVTNPGPCLLDPLLTQPTVPFVMAYPPGHPNKRTFSGATDGKLCDVAPTVLAAMGLPIPPEMDGRSLLA